VILQSLLARFTLLLLKRMEYKIKGGLSRKMIYTEWKITPDVVIQVEGHRNTQVLNIPLLRFLKEKSLNLCERLTSRQNVFHMYII